MINVSAIVGYVTPMNRFAAWRVPMNVDKLTFNPTTGKGSRMIKDELDSSIIYREQAN
jgi:hypothetical protein